MRNIPLDDTERLRPLCISLNVGRKGKKNEYITDKINTITTCRRAIKRKKKRSRDLPPADPIPYRLRRIGHYAPLATARIDIYSILEALLRPKGKE